MRLFTKNGVHYADYKDNSEPVKCDSLYQMWGRAFEACKIEKSLGHKVGSVTCCVDRLVPSVTKKTVKITIGEAVRV